MHTLIWTGKPVLKTVATSALYTDLTAQPTKLSQFTNDVSASGSNSFAIAGASPWLQFQGTGASYYQIGQASSAGAWSSYAAAGDLVIRGLGSNSIWLQQGTGGYGLCVNYNNIVYVQKPISVVNVWTTLPLQNGASAYGSGYQFPSYCMGLRWNDTFEGPHSAQRHWVQHQFRVCARFILPQGTPDIFWQFELVYG